VKMLVRIGHQDFVLPDEKGLTTLMATLGKAILVDDYRWQDRDPHILLREEITLKFETLPAKTNYRVPDDKPQLLRLKGGQS
jgi:hypothetical protein